MEDFAASCQAVGPEWLPAREMRLELELRGRMRHFGRSDESVIDLIAFSWMTPSDCSHNRAITVLLPVFM
jgi:hypothetical protein